MDKLDAVYVSLIQMEIKYGIKHREENLNRALELIDIAVRGHGPGGLPIDIVGLPELWDVGVPGVEVLGTPESIRKWREWGEPVPGSELLQKISDKAAEHGVYIQAGSVAEVDEEGNIYNAATLWDRNGKFLGKYRKVQPWIPEPAVPGNEFPVFDTDIGKIGMMICYDGDFPEVARILALNGAELILRPSEWNDPFSCEGLDWWRIANVSRAVENQCYIAACSSVGVDPLEFYTGHSMIVDPYGRIVAAASESTCERVISANIDINEVRRIRETWKSDNHLKDLRVELYAEVYKKAYEKSKNIKEE